MCKVLAMIPARGGSKRVPGKNKKLLAGKPLIAWSIETALAVSSLKVVVSTDDMEIAKLAEQYGAATPFMRAAEYASDQSSVIDAVLETINFYEGLGECFDTVLLLQPTSPFRSEDSIRQAIRLFTKANAESVVSVSMAKTHPYWCKRVVGGALLPFDIQNDASLLRSQDLPEIYQLNGSIYLASVETLKVRKSFYSDNTRALVLDTEEEAIDIDTPFDWLLAEAVAKKRGEQ